MWVIETYNRFKSYISNLSVYFLASLVPMLLSLVSNPFIAKNMDPDDYAIVGYYGAFITLFTPLVDFYFLHFYTKRFYELDEARRYHLRATIFKSFLSFSFIMTGVALLSLFGYRTFFNNNSEISFFPYAVLALVKIPLSCLFSLELVDFRMNRESKPFFRLSVSNALMATAVMVLFVVVFKWGAIGNLSASLLTTAIMFVYMLVKNWRILKEPFDKEIFKDAVKFCWPLALASMLTFFSNGYDRVFLEKNESLEVLGYYSVGVTIASYIRVFSDSINSTFQPDIYESIVKRNFRKSFKFIALKLVILSVVIVCFIILSPFVVRILTFGKYVASTKYAVIASLASLTSMMYYSVSQITVALGYTSITLYNKILGSVLSVLCYALLIRSFGAIGAAWGMVVSYIFFFLGNSIMVYYKYKRRPQ